MSRFWNMGSQHAVHVTLPREQLPQIFKGLELQRIPRRIKKEHRRLFPSLPFEPRIRLDDEAHPRRRHALRQLLPLLLVQHHSKVRYGYIMPVHRIAVPRR